MPAISPDNPHAPAPVAPGRTRRLALGAALALLLASQAAAIFTVGAHWDEFVLLDRTATTARTGVLHSGGRPGLAEIFLLPVVRECVDEIAALRRARALWLPVTVAFVAGFGLLMWRVAPQRRDRGAAAGVGVALLVLVPAFFATSIQVRTDPIALAGGVWGGVALLASRRRPAWAIAAGVLFAAGFLASQKLAYVAALAGALAAADHLFRREIRVRREALRSVLCASAFAAVFAAFGAATTAGFEIPENHASRQVMTPSYLEGGLSVFHFYRNTIGYSQYAAMLPSLIPHALLLAGLLVASAAALRRRERAPELLAAWAILALGAAVAGFHAGAFRYFWLTLGLFPAAAFALCQRRVRELALPGHPSVRRLVVAGWWLLLAIPALISIGTRWIDTQSVQRESFAFVHRNFAPDDAGFHPEGGLFCRPGGDPIPAFVSHTIYRRFETAERERNTKVMMDAFRREPVHFLVESFRLNQFPVELRRFWAEHYQPYRASVFVAGSRLEGESGASRDFELIAPGRYRWIPWSGPAALRVDGHVLDAGGVMELEAGAHTARFDAGAAGGILVLAVADPPGVAPLAFYEVE